MLSPLAALRHHEASKGVLLVMAAIVALVLANTSAQPAYAAALDLPVPLPGKPLTLLLFVNDFLMAAFFLLVGMELKRELAEGELSSRSRIMLPAIAALGGMIGPAVIYWWFNSNRAEAQPGWAIPCATDIAFALGIMALLGKRVPAGLKVFLTALAVLDDLGAIIIIALFYTAHLKPWFLLGAVGVFVIMGLMNRRGVTRVWLYLLLGTIMWWFTLKSGVHATLAGVATAMAIPMRGPGGKEVMAPFEHALEPWISFGVLPIFALANAGVMLGELGPDGAMNTVSLGAAVGLLGGKVVGVFGASVLAVVLGLGSLPSGTRWSGLFGVAILCGIGFTMSIFIAELAFTGTAEGMSSELLRGQAKAGILLGSAVAALLGLAVLAVVSRRAGGGGGGGGSARGAGAGAGAGARSAT